MSQERSSRPRSKRSGVDFAEEKAWISFYRRVGNPAIAVEVIHELQSDPEMKRAHLALYLRCKESLRAQKARLARNKRIGQFARSLCSALFVAPVLSIRRLSRQSGEIAVECLPQVRPEPAVRQVRQLAKDAEFAQQRSAFSSNTVAEAPEQNASSSATKTA